MIGAVQPPNAFRGSEGSSMRVVTGLVRPADFDGRRRWHCVMSRARAARGDCFAVGVCGGSRRCDGRGAAASSRREAHAWSGVVLAIADGATCLSDLAAFRCQEAMFGAVASEATVWRTFNHVGPVVEYGCRDSRCARTTWSYRRLGARPALRSGALCQLERRFYCAG